MNRSASKPCSRSTDSGRNRRHLAAATVMLAAAAGITHAESTWTGQGGGSGVQLWNSPVNWTPGAIPAAGADVRFKTFGSGTVINAAGNRSVNSVYIDTAQSFVLQNFAGVGNTITLNSGFLQRTATSSGTQTLSSNVALNGTGLWDVRGAGELVVEGALSTGNSVAFEKSGPGALRFISNASNVDGGLTLSGGTTTLEQSAIVNLSNPSTANATTIRSAVLLVRGGAALNTRNDVHITQGGVATISGASSRWSNTVGNGLSNADFWIGTSDSGALTVTNGATFSTAGNLKIAYGTASTGTLTIDGGGVVSSGSGRLGSGSMNSAVATVSGAGSKWNVAGVLEVGGTHASSAGTLSISNGGAVNVGTVMAFNNNLANVNVNAGSLTVGGLQSNGVVGAIHLAADPAGGAALTVKGPASGDFYGAITGPGSVVVDSTARQTLGGTAISHTGMTTINSGTLALPNGFSNAGGAIVLNAGTLEVGGTLNRALTSGTISASRYVFAADQATIGDASRTDGVDLNGHLNIYYRATLKDADLANVEGTLTLGHNGELTSTNGIRVKGTLSARSGLPSIIGPFVNDGFVPPPSVNDGTRLTFKGPVSGTGSFSGVITFADKFTPGNNGAAMTSATGGITFGPNATYGVDVGGLFTGVSYDYLQVTGNATLDGKVDVSMFNNFTPAQGQSFLVLTASEGFAGTRFDSLVGQRVNATTWLLPLYTTNALTLAVALPGDSNLDASVTISDFSTLASHFNQSGFDWTGGDFDGNGTVGISDFASLASNFNRTLAAPLPRGGSVPEPVGLGVIAMAGIVATRRQRSASRR